MNPPPDELRVTILRLKKKRSGFEVTPDRGEPVPMPTEIIAQHGIWEGKEFDESTWQEILTASADERCYQQLLRLLNQRAHTQGEMNRKLRQRHYEAPTVRRALDRAARYGLIDDAAFARQFIYEKLHFGKLGRRRIVAELRKRGLSGSAVDDAFAAYQEAAVEHDDPTPVDVERDQALDLATRKWASLTRREDDPRKLKQKLLQYLAGRGFSADICYATLDAVQRAAREAGDGDLVDDED